MEQNPVNIVVALIAMAFVFLGLMQYMSTMSKNNEKTRADLFDKWQLAKSEANDLKDEKERLLSALETSNDLAKKWKKVAGYYYKKWKEEVANHQTIRKTTTTEIVKPMDVKPDLQS